VRIQVQGFVDAALERLLHDEIERAQMVDAVATDPALQQGPEIFLQALGRQLPLDGGIVLGSSTNTPMLEMLPRSARQAPGRGVWKTPRTRSLPRASPCTER
jgi:hypothetical protein